MRCLLLILAAGVVYAAEPLKMVVELAPIKGIHVGGLLGQAIAANQNGRLKTFIGNEASRPIDIFSPAKAEANFAGDWNGEHAGKWLYTAARAAHRTGDAQLAASVRKVADFLVARQEADGYLGTYSSKAPSRFTSPDVAGKRTWDIWVHSYIVIGLLEVHRYFPDGRYLAAARKIGDLCWRTIVRDNRDITTMGSHFGLSSTILLEPAVELYRATGDRRYLELAETVVAQFEARPELRLVGRSLKGEDPQAMGDGKIYQLLWTFDGLLKLAEAGASPDYRRTADNAWSSVVRNHLNPAGGPWGGAGWSYELFNPKEYFSPYGMVETCSIMSWLHLNRDLLRLTGDASYAEEIEKTAYNSLLAAQHPNGDDWAYFTFPNGSWTATYYWACCKSSGSVSLEELPPLIFGRRDDGISVNLYTKAEATIDTPAAGPVRVQLETKYPDDGVVTLKLQPAKAAAFPVYVRIPSWAKGATISVPGGQSVSEAKPGTYAKLQGTWRPGDRIELKFPMDLRVESKSTTTPHEEGDLARVDYVALLRGPLVYATGLIDGYKKQETIRLPKSGAETLFVSCPPPDGAKGPAFRLKIPQRQPITFVPFYEAGGRASGNWHSTWLSVAWE